MTIAVHCKKSSWNHSLPWRRCHVSRENFHCMEGVQKFHVSMEISCNFHTLHYHYLLMTSLDPWNVIHGCMEWFPLVHGIIAMGPWNAFRGYMEVFPWVHEKVSLGHRAPLILIKIFFNATRNRLLQEVMYIQLPPSPLTGWGFDILLHC
jgi:hypothetical protein